MKYYTKKWYLNGCVDAPVIDDKTYCEYDTNIHDTKIIKSESREDGSFALIIDTKDIWSNYSEIVFCDYQIITNNNLYGAFCIADEIYVKDDRIEYHLLLWSENIQDANKLGYFTIQAKKVLFYEKDAQNADSLLKEGRFITCKSNTDV